MRTRFSSWLVSTRELSRVVKPSSRRATLRLRETTLPALPRRVGLASSESAALATIAPASARVSTGGASMDSPGLRLATLLSNCWVSDEELPRRRRGTRLVGELVRPGSLDRGLNVEPMLLRVRAALEEALAVEAALAGSNSGPLCSSRESAGTAARRRVGAEDAALRPRGADNSDVPGAFMSRRWLLRIVALADFA